MNKLTVQIDEFTVDIYCDEVDAVIALDEAQRRGIPLGGPYSGLYHTAHTSPGEDHIHVFMKNNQIFALNKSGTAHDQSHGIRIPNRVVKGIKITFPWIRLPKDNLIENISLADDMVWLTEDTGK